MKLSSYLGIKLPSSQALMHVSPPEVLLHLGTRLMSISSSCGVLKIAVIWSRAAKLTHLQFRRFHFDLAARRGIINSYLNLASKVSGDSVHPHRPRSYLSKRGDNTKPVKMTTLKGFTGQAYQPQEEKFVRLMVHLPIAYPQELNVTNSLTMAGRLPSSTSFTTTPNSPTCVETPRRSSTQ